MRVLFFINNRWFLEDLYKNGFSYFLICLVLKLNKKFFGIIDVDISEKLVVRIILKKKNNLKFYKFFVC